MIIRTALPDDAAGMCRVLRDIAAEAGRERAVDEAFVVANYIRNPSDILCSVAADDADGILGFQSLIRAVAGNRFGVPQGWGIIGTHISPRAHRRGVGKALFSRSREAAVQAGLEKIDAFIGAGNAAALRYYEAMGFRTWREPDGIVQKVFDVPAGGAEAG